MHVNTIQAYDRVGGHLVKEAGKHCLIYSML